MVNSINGPRTCDSIPREDGHLLSTSPSAIHPYGELSYITDAAASALNIFMNIIPLPSSFASIYETIPKHILLLLDGLHTSHRLPRTNKLAFATGRDKICLLPE